MSISIISIRFGLLRFDLGFLSNHESSFPVWISSIACWVNSMYVSKQESVHFPRVSLSCYRIIGIIDTFPEEVCYNSFSIHLITSSYTDIISAWHHILLLSSNRLQDCLPKPHYLVMILLILHQQQNGILANITAWTIVEPPPITELWPTVIGCQIVYCQMEEAIIQ